MTTTYIKETSFLLERTVQFRVLSSSTTGSKFSVHNTTKKTKSSFSKLFMHTANYVSCLPSDNDLPLEVVISEPYMSAA